MTTISQSMLSSSRSLPPQNDIVNIPRFTTRTLRVFRNGSSRRLQRKETFGSDDDDDVDFMMMTMIMTKMMTRTRTMTMTMVLIIKTTTSKQEQRERKILKWRSWLRKVTRGYFIGGEEGIKVFPPGFQFDWVAPWKKLGWQFYKYLLPSISPQLLH